MKLNKKGFTLVELLAVVVILLMISVLAVSSISSAIERNKAKQDESKKEIIVSYAELYYDSHKNSINNGDCIKLADLDLSESERVDANGDPFIGGVKVTISGNKVTFSYDTSCS